MSNTSERKLAHPGEQENVKKGGTPGNQEKQDKNRKQGNIDEAEQRRKSQTEISKDKEARRL